MSYVVHLYPKNNQKIPFTQKELTEKLEEAYDVALWKGDNKSFDVNYIGGSPGNELEFHFDTDHYSVSTSYSASGLDFKNVIKKVALLLQLYIEDQQIMPLEKIDPSKYRVDDPRSIHAIETAKKAIEEFNLKLIVPASSKYFLLFFVNSINPEDHQWYTLFLDDGRYYANKVEQGESLKVVIDREIMNLTGSKVYQIIEMKDNYDSAPDKQGNSLPRTAIFFQVPYFDPKQTKTKYPMKWTLIDSL